MKVIFKPTKIATYEAVKVNDSLLGILTDTENLKQELLKVEGGYILKAHEIEKTEQYQSEQDIYINLKENDYLIKTPKGYSKPIYQVFEVDKKLEKAIKEINNV